MSSRPPSRRQHCLPDLGAFPDQCRCLCGQRFSLLVVMRQPALDPGDVIAVLSHPLVLDRKVLKVRLGSLDQTAGLGLLAVQVTGPYLENLATTPQLFRCGGE